MPPDVTTRSRVARTISMSSGIVAVTTAFGVGLARPERVSTVYAHQRFVVVTVTAKTAATPPATVTESDKPHELRVTRATPQIRAAPRTMMVNP
jgi:hypothetical protein